MNNEIINEMTASATFVAGAVYLPGLQEEINKHTHWIEV